MNLKNGTVRLSFKDGGTQNLSGVTEATEVDTGEGEALLVTQTVFEGGAIDAPRKAATSAVVEHKFYIRELRHYSTRNGA